MLSTPPFSFRRLSPEEARRDYPHLWWTVRLAMPYLGEDDLTLVVSLASDTCQACHAASATCHCWDDD